MEAHELGFIRQPSSGGRFRQIETWRSSDNSIELIDISSEQLGEALSQDVEAIYDAL
jgi:hypothetical protein